MHLNMQVFKHGKPIYWIIGAVIIFVIFWKVASGSSKSSGTGTITTVSSGPTDAQVNAAAGVSAAQLQANAEIASQQIAANAQIAGGELALAAQRDVTAGGVATATLEQQAHIYDTSAAADVAHYTAGLDANVALAGINAQQAIAFNQNEYSFATARVAAETSLASQEIQAGVIRSSFDLQSHLSDNQALVFNTASNNQRIAYVAGEAFGNLDKVKANDRDNIAALALAASTGTAITYRDASSGSFTTQ